MTASTAANHGSARSWQTRGAAGWLGLAASPTFALMAWVAANDARPMTMCFAGSGVVPLGGMTAMYLLMGVFHLAPWLKLAAARPASGQSPAHT